MSLSSFTPTELTGKLRLGKLTIGIADFAISIRSPLPQVAKGLALLYADYPVIEKGQFIDFSIRISSPNFTRRWIRPQVNFQCDDQTPFKPLPLNQAFAMFEWGLNWVIANHCHQFAIVHAAVVEKNGRTVIFPGSPGSGKSTLCAALVCRGWRLFSDEMALVSLKSGLIHPAPRPIALKNQSIEIIKAFGKNLVFGDIVADTAKGDVSHMQPPKESVWQKAPGTPFAIIFPKYEAGKSLSVTDISQGNTLLRLAENCFNYPVLGSDGFHGLVDIAERCPGKALHYSHLDDAIAILERLVGVHGE